MGKFRKTIHREVYEILDSSVFTSNDFEVSFGESNENEYLVHISLRYKPELTFSVGYHDANHYQIKHIPGELYEEDEYIVTGIQIALERILNWAIEARNELKAQSPIYRDVDELKKSIEEHLRTEGEESEFSVQEINSLKNKFEALSDRVEKLERENLVTKKQFEEFQEGVQQILDDLEYYPKETWVNTASNKIYKIIVAIGKSKEGQKIIANGAKKLLGLDN